ncbi:MAG: bifunctional glutamate N-acetyltransferase/amino-acid acetyltransferase ArgJ [Phycisphaerae bacterium]|nr:bifunctional glutamate N-acetyltransferase/amino-acid acetyltransferase ArgJ [Phycisphaerae bacterium]
MPNTTITAPLGFLAAGVKAGIKPWDKPDVALLVCERPAAAAAVFTTNQVVAAPVIYDRSILKGGRGKLEAVVVNSGNANACTGVRGIRDARRMADLAGEATHCPADLVLVSSTGVIGRPLPMARIEHGIIDAASALGNSAEHGESFVRGIMTTDTRMKTAFATVKIGRATVKIAGCIKGAGMLAPRMATMLGYITTDAAISPALLHAALTDIADVTFNSITIDGHTSTNDTVAVLASGLAGHPTINARGAAFARFAAALKDICYSLGEQVVRDGEGATKLVRVIITGAASAADAKLAARAIAESPLAKAALHGGDPNWGRFTSAAGYSGAKCNFDRMKCAIGKSLVIFRNGQPTGAAVDKVAKLMKSDTVDVTVDLGVGKASTTMLTCDLSEEYVTINADYTT